MRVFSLAIFAFTAGCATMQAPSPTLAPDFVTGVIAAPEPQQEGRIAMSVHCPADCTLGARILATEAEAIWISLSGDDFGAVYAQRLGQSGHVVDQSLLFGPTPSPGGGAPISSPFPSPTPVYLEIGLKNGELTGWANGARIWGFAKTFETELSILGQWSVRSDGAAISQLVFENPQARARSHSLTGEGFSTQQLDDLFYSETVSTADINRDGFTDIITAGRYYLGPNFAVAHEIYLTTPASPEGYSTGLVSATDDFNGDGWVDLLTIESGTPAGHPALVFLNPQGANSHWDRFVALEHTQVEGIAYSDVDADGVNELVVIVDGRIGLARPNADSQTPWTFTPISEQRPRWSPHGIGVGDIDGDGRLDVVHASGWFRQPADPNAAWAFTPADFGVGAQLSIEDVNGDGRSDVIGTLDAHGWGLAWHEQQPNGAFTRHLIMGNPAQTPPTEALATFSQPHAIVVADINGDGLSDIITGKRWWAHRDTYRDPDGHGRPVLYAFLQQRNGADVRFAPNFIGDHVGVGNQIAVTDVTRDGKPDIITSARRGTFVYINELP